MKLVCCLSLSSQRQAKTKARDLAENGVKIELMHIGQDFDVSLFYQVSLELTHIYMYALITNQYDLGGLGFLQIQKN